MNKYIQTKSLSIYIVLYVLIFIPFISFSQTDSTKLKLVENLAIKIYNSYLDANIAKAMCDTIKYKLSTGQYDSTLNMDEFVYEINKDLRRVSRDNHIIIDPAHRSMTTDPKYLYLDNLGRKKIKRLRKKITRRLDAIDKKYKARTKQDMFNYGEIKILPGNIGYVEIKDFKSAFYSKKEYKSRISLESVLTYLKNSNSIILDFRENLGGNIFHAAKFSSHFAESKGAYFITTEILFRIDSSGRDKEYKFPRKYYTDTTIKNNLVGSKHIYILTSKRTFSAGELVTQKLRLLNQNTTVVGEATTGGGNGYCETFFDNYFTAVIPNIRVFDENNFNHSIEGIGIKPDIQSSADSAFSIAYGLALLPNTDTTGVKTKYYKKERTIIDNREPYFHRNFSSYIGDYRKVVITLENDKLFMTYDFYLRQLLIPDAIDFFLTERFKFVRFVRNTNNEVVEIQIKHKDGYLEKFRKV
jgi:C-terminal processing protease CtpA/Prc